MTATNLLKKIEQACDNNLIDYSDLINLGLSIQRKKLIRNECEVVDWVGQQVIRDDFSNIQKIILGIGKGNNVYINNAIINANIGNNNTHISVYVKF